MSAMVDHIQTGASVPYKTRQSLSIFLGQPLDATMQPQSIQTIRLLSVKTHNKRNRAPRLLKANEILQKWVKSPKTCKPKIKHGFLVKIRRKQQIGHD